MLSQVYVPPSQVVQEIDSKGATPKAIANGFYDVMVKLLSAYANPNEPITLYGKTLTTMEEKTSITGMTVFNLAIQDYSRVLEMAFNIQTTVYSLEKQIGSSLAGSA